MSTTSPPSSMPRLPAWLRGVIWVVVCLALLAVFAMYLQPDFMLTLADQVWACF
ncbi:hypothetical protein [Comamonas kerstersii]|uniref:hypothetical protein n=1 Tax=Comamonas kerstersii TaxID=225992 RepID=UPI000A6796F8|nr:hypothetical protein [Comamonas kerstersii]QTW20709.1 hypothetical protein H8N02_06835 [Comamonas kerstersii]